MNKPWPMLRRLAWHETAIAERLAAASDGSRIEIRTAMMPMTTSSSTSVKPRRCEVILIRIPCGLGRVKERKIWLRRSSWISPGLLISESGGRKRNAPNRSEPSFATVRCQRQTHLRVCGDPRNTLKPSPAKIPSLPHRSKHILDVIPPRPCCALEPHSPLIRPAS